MQIVNPQRHMRPRSAELHLKITNGPLTKFLALLFCLTSFGLLFGIPPLIVALQNWLDRSWALCTYDVNVGSAWLINVGPVG